MGFYLFADPLVLFRLQSHLINYRQANKPSPP